MASPRPVTSNSSSEITSTWSKPLQQVQHRRNSPSPTAWIEAVFVALSTVIFTVMLLLIATAMAGAHTQLAITGGFQMGSGMELVSTEDAGTHLISYIMSLIGRLIGNVF